MPATLAATVAIRTENIRKAIIRDSFTIPHPDNHRLEPVANVHGIEFINDSGSCTINGTWFALESMRKPVIWIAGGLDRMLDYAQLKSLVAHQVKAIIFLGEEPKKIRKAFAETEIPVLTADNMDEAVELAYYMGKTGDAVLLSPGCPSPDRFEDDEERGNRFRIAVKNL